MKQNRLQISRERTRFLRMLRKNSWLILLSGLTALMLYDMIVRCVYQPVYTSYAGVVIRPSASQPDVRAKAEAARTLAKQFNAFLHSPALQEKAAGKLGLKEFPALIHTQQVEMTNYLNLAAAASSPELAYRSLQVLLEVCTELPDTFLQDMEMETDMGPLYPIEPSFPPSRLGYVLAAAFGMLLALMGILLLSRSRKQGSPVKPDEKDFSLTISIRGILGRVYHSPFPVLILMLVFGCLGALTGIIRYKPVYRANTTFTLWVRDGMSDLTHADGERCTTEKSMAAELQKAFPAFLKTHSFETRLRETFGFTEKELPVTLQAEAMEEPGEMCLTVSGEDPRLTYEVLSFVLKEYPENANVLYTDAGIMVSEAAEIPERPENPRLCPVTLAGGIYIGFLLAVLWIILRELHG